MFPPLSFSGELPDEQMHQAFLFINKFPVPGNELFIVLRLHRKD